MLEPLAQDFAFLMSFFFYSDDRSASFTYVIQRTDGAKNLIYNSALFFFGGARLWYRKLLMERLEGFISDFDVMFFLKHE